ncbi:hypothetical protein PR202_gb11772 [Eleusine coracana subsp. coracana]|uniref:Uncharacterized protein n=1 Tax=Eleusine coracana subsp. coracana TaxID=191504 RepID=A0AAV5EP75_ELECO|nr:hypothetical protein PR202_gb11772 [Eleusine coracana subsp. coracana]
MESGGVITDGGWRLPGLSSQVEESEIMDQLLGTFPSSGEESQPWSIQAPNACYFQYNTSSSASSSTSSNGSGNFSRVVPSEYGGYYMSDSNETLSLNSCTAPLHLNLVQEEGLAQCMEDIVNPSHGSSNSSCGDLEYSSMHLLDLIGSSVKRKLPEQGKLDGQMRNRKCARKYDLKRVKKIMQQEGEDGIIALRNVQSLSRCTSENNSNASSEPPVAANLNGKAQAGHRSATESQSLYARLLSSDKMWMYAPIAYNGMNIGIDLSLYQQ